MSFRLLNDYSQDKERERQIIRKMKFACGDSYTEILDEMLKDLENCEALNRPIVEELKK